MPVVRHTSSELLPLLQCGENACGIDLSPTMTGTTTLSAFRFTKDAWQNADYTDTVARIAKVGEADFWSSVNHGHPVVVTDAVPIGNGVNALSCAGIVSKLPGAQVRTVTTVLQGTVAEGNRPDDRGEPVPMTPPGSWVETKVAIVTTAGVSAKRYLRSQLKAPGFAAYQWDPASAGSDAPGIGRLLQGAVPTPYFMPPPPVPGATKRKVADHQKSKQSEQIIGRSAKAADADIKRLKANRRKADDADDEDEVERLSKLIKAALKVERDRGAAQRDAAIKRLKVDRRRADDVDDEDEVDRLSKLIRALKAAPASAGAGLVPRAAGSTDTVGDSTAADDAAGSASLWFGPEGSGTLATVDNTQCTGTLSVQLSGATRWRLQRAEPAGSQAPSAGSEFPAGAIYTSGWMPSHSFEVKAGEAVFFPPGYIYESMHSAKSQCSARQAIPIDGRRSGAFLRRNLPIVTRVRDLRSCAALARTLATLDAVPPALAKSLDRGEFDTGLVTGAAYMVAMAIDAGPSADGVLEAGEIMRWADVPAETAAGVIRYHDLDDDGVLSRFEFVDGFTDWVENEAAINQRR